MEREAFEPLGYQIAHPALGDKVVSSTKAILQGSNQTLYPSPDGNPIVTAGAHLGESQYTDQALSSGDKGTTNFGSLKRALCVSLLVSGRPQAFTDLFSFPSEELELLDIEGEGQSATLRRLASACAAAEAAAASGDFVHALALRQELAKLLSSHGAPRSAMYIQRTCLPLTAEMPPSAAVASLFREMGDSERAAGRWASAEQFYLESLQVARVSCAEESVREAARRLVECGDKNAEEAEREGRIQEAVQLRRGCLAYAELSHDETLRWSVLHSLGLTLNAKGDGGEAAELQKECLRIAMSANDRGRESRARSALAATYMALGCEQEAVDELETLLEASTQTGDASTQSQTCAALSVVYQQSGEVAKAVALCQRHFDFASKSGDIESLEEARASLGLARARFHSDDLKHMISGDIQELARWKCNPEPPKKA